MGEGTPEQDRAAPRQAAALRTAPGMVAPDPTELKGVAYEIFILLVSFLSVVNTLIVLLFFTVWLRATLPRLRYDQLMALVWKFLIEFAFIWVMITGVVVIAKEQDWSMWIVLPAAIAGGLFIGGVLYASVPTKTEVLEEIK